MTHRCAPCDINYPTDQTHKQCDVCGQNTVPNFSQAPHYDWQERVNSALSPVNADEVFGWRFGQLVRVGFSPSRAMELATHTDVRRICDVAVKAGPELAYSIFV